MIDINKQYRTRDGREVRIYATDGQEDWPIHGAILKSFGITPLTQVNPNLIIPA